MSLETEIYANEADPVKHMRGRVVSKTAKILSLDCACSSEITVTFSSPHLFVSLRPVF